MESHGPLYAHSNECVQTGEIQRSSTDYTNVSFLVLTVLQLRRMLMLEEAGREMSGTSL